MSPTGLLNHNFVKNVPCLQFLVSIFIQKFEPLCNRRLASNLVIIHIYTANYVLVVFNVH